MLWRSTQCGEGEDRRGANPSGRRQGRGRRPAAGFLVQALGERVPGELIRALKVRGATCAVAPTAVPTSAGDDATRVPDQDDHADIGPIINLSPPLRIVDATPPLERPMLPESTSEQSDVAGV